MRSLVKGFVHWSKNIELTLSETRCWYGENDCGTVNNWTIFYKLTMFYVEYLCNVFQMYWKDKYKSSSNYLLYSDAGI